MESYLKAKPYRKNPFKKEYLLEESYENNNYLMESL